MKISHLLFQSWVGSPEPRRKDKSLICVALFHAEVLLFIKCHTMNGKIMDWKSIFCLDNEGNDDAEKSHRELIRKLVVRKMQEKTNPMSRNFSVEKRKDFNDISWNTHGQEQFRDVKWISIHYLNLASWHSFFFFLNEKVGICEGETGIR